MTNLGNHNTIPDSLAPSKNHTVYYMWNACGDTLEFLEVRNYILSFDNNYYQANGFRETW